jgi:hypothetical protein
MGILKIVESKSFTRDNKIKKVEYSKKIFLEYLSLLSPMLSILNYLVDLGFSSSYNFLIKKVYFILCYRIRDPPFYLILSISLFTIPWSRYSGDKYCWIIRFFDIFTLTTKSLNYPLIFLWYFYRIIESICLWKHLKGKDKNKENWN